MASKLLVPVKLIGILIHSFLQCLSNTSCDGKQLLDPGKKKIEKERKERGEVGIGNRNSVCLLFSLSQKRSDSPILSRQLLTAGGSARRSAGLHS
jgi:hypothetical protein